MGKEQLQVVSKQAIDLPTIFIHILPGKSERRHGPDCLLYAAAAGLGVSTALAAVAWSLIQQCDAPKAIRVLSGLPCP